MNDESKKMIEEALDIYSSIPKKGGSLKDTHDINLAIITFCSAKINSTSTNKLSSEMESLNRSIIDFKESNDRHSENILDQSRELKRATWVLAISTVILSSATVALVVATCAGGN